MLEVSFLSAWLISRACRPICGSPISPSISAFGVKRGTESIDDHVDRTPSAPGMSAISNACSPVVGLGNQQFLDLDAQLRGVLRIERVSASMKAAVPPIFCAWADHREREGRLSRGLGPVDLDHAARAASALLRARRPGPREAGRHHLHVLCGRGVHLHDGTLAELFFDLGESGLAEPWPWLLP